MNMMEDLTVKKREALEELKRRIQDEVPDCIRDDEFLYLRFLRARDFNINAAEDMLRNHLSWRKANQIDTIINDFVKPEIVLKYLPLKRIGFDKEGHPVRYFAIGNTDCKGILKSVKRNECIKSVIQCFEEDVYCMKEQSAKLGKPIEQWTYIFDFEHYSFSKATHKPTLETLVTLFMAYEANYPERLKAAYVINASVYFSIVFSVIKPLLSGSTVKKITIFGKDGWKEELLKSINAEDLPAFLGGKKTDPDGNPMCNTFVKHGELVPEEYYLTKSTKRLCNEPGVQKLIVARMSKMNLNLHVMEPGSLIEWEFETEGKDIGFGLFYKASNCDEDVEELIPNQKIDTQFVSESGMYQCNRAGIYILMFDNTYSWIYQKEIYYKTAVVKPKYQENGH